MADIEGIDLRQLRCFLSAVRHGSMSRAALECDLSQPAFSLRIKALEQSLGVRLLHRNGRGVAATAAGRQFHDRLAPLMAQLQHVLGEAAGETEQAGLPALNVGVVPSMLYRVTDAMGAQHDALAMTRGDLQHLRIVEGFSGHLRQWLVQGEIDLAVCTAMFRQRDICQLPAMREPLELVGLDAGGWAGPDVPFDMLARIPLIVGSEHHTIRRLLDRTAQQHGKALNVAYQIDGLVAQLQFVAQRKGFAILPRGTVQSYGQGAALKCWRLVQPSVDVQVVVAYLRRAGAARPGVDSVAGELAWRLSQGGGAS